MSALLGGLVSLLLGTVAAVLMVFSPEGQMVSLRLLLPQALIVPFVVLAALTISYLNERRKRWLISQVGVELWRGAHRSGIFTWSEIRAVKLARFTLCLRTQKGAFHRYLLFVNRSEITPFIPEEKREWSYQL